MAYKLVWIAWQDSIQPDPAWRHVSDLPRLEVVNCVSVGWVLQEGPDVTMLAPNLGDVGGDMTSENAQAMGIIRIPTVSITRMVELSVPV